MSIKFKIISFKKLRTVEEYFELKHYIELAFQQNKNLTSSPAYQNYLFNNNNSSLEKLIKSDKFKNGEYLVFVTPDNQFIMSAGYYIQNDVVISGIRLLISPPSPSYKRYPLFSGFILPEILKRTPDLPHLFTFNQYNTRLMKHVFLDAKESKKKFIKFDSSYEIALNSIKNFKISQNCYNINNTPQFFVFDKLTEEELVNRLNYSKAAAHENT